MRERERERFTGWGKMIQYLKLVTVLATWQYLYECIVLSVSFHFFLFNIRKGDCKTQAGLHKTEHPKLNLPYTYPASFWSSCVKSVFPFLEHKERSAKHKLTCTRLNTQNLTRHTRTLFQPPLKTTGLLSTKHFPVSLFCSSTSLSVNQINQ